MTTTGAAVAARAGNRRAATASTRDLPAGSTPSRLRRMLVLVLATTVMSCAVATALTLGRRDTVMSVRDRTSLAFLAALEAHAVLSDADRAVWASLRSGEAQLVGPGQDYQDDITTAGQDLAQLAALEGTGGVTSRQLQTVNGQLVNYQGLVGQADATYRSGAASGSQTAGRNALGYAYLRYASKALRDPQGGLLARIDELAAVNRRTLSDQRAASWTSPWILLAYAGVALPLLGYLVYSQALLRRRFKRTVNPPLVLATALVVGVSIWLAAVSFRADQAFTRAHDVALARLTGVWHTETRGADAAARELRAGIRGDSPGPRNAAAKASRGVEVAATQPARRELDSQLATAADSGGLLIALPLVAVATAGLAFLGLKRRLDEYRA